MCVELNIHRTACDGREPAIIDPSGTMAFNPFRPPPVCSHHSGDSKTSSSVYSHHSSSPPSLSSSPGPCASHGECCVFVRLRMCIAVCPCGFWKPWHKVVVQDEDWLGRKADVYTLEGVYPEALWEHHDGRVYIFPVDGDHNNTVDDTTADVVQPSWEVREDFFREAENLASATMRLRHLVKKTRAAGRGLVRPPSGNEVEATIGNVLEAQVKILKLQALWERSWFSRAVVQPFPSTLVLQRPRGLNMHVQGPGKRLTPTTDAMIAELRGQPAPVKDVDGDVLHPRIAVRRAPHVDGETADMFAERREVGAQMVRRLKLLRDVARFRTPLNATNHSRTNARKNLAMDKHPLKGNLDDLDDDDDVVDKEERVALQDIVEGMVPVNGSGCNEFTVAKGRVLIVRQAGSFLGRATPQRAMVVSVREAVDAAKLECLRLKLEKERKAAANAGVARQRNDDGSNDSNGSDDNDNWRRVSCVEEMEAMDVYVDQQQKRQDQQRRHSQQQQQQQQQQKKKKPYVLQGTTEVTDTSRRRRSSTVSSMSAASSSSLLRPCIKQTQQPQQGRRKSVSFGGSQDEQEDGAVATAPVITKSRKGKEREVVVVVVEVEADEKKSFFPQPPRVPDSQSQGRDAARGRRDSYVPSQDQSQSRDAPRGRRNSYVPSQNQNQTRVPSTSTPYKTTGSYRPTSPTAPTTRASLPRPQSRRRPSITTANTPTPQQKQFSSAPASMYVGRPSRQGSEPSLAGAMPRRQSLAAALIMNARQA